MRVKRKGVEIEVALRTDLSTDTRIVLEAVSPRDGGRYQAIFFFRDGKWNRSSDSHHTSTGRCGIGDDLFRHFNVAKWMVLAVRANIAVKPATRAVKAALSGGKMSRLPKGQLTLLPK